MKKNLSHYLLLTCCIVAWATVGISIINSVFINSEYLKGFINGLDALIIILCLIAMIREQIYKRENEKAWKRIEKELNEKIKGSGNNNHE